MEDADRTLNKLRRIEELWDQLGHAALNSLEYKILIKKIRVEVDQYRVLLDAAKKPAKTKVNWNTP